MEKVTYIIPLYEFNEEVKTLLPNALKSIKGVKPNEFSIILVGPESVLKETESIVAGAKLKGSVKYVYNEGDTDFCSQVNKAVMMCTTPFFCIVEYDDTITDYWQGVASRYEKDTKASILLPITEFFSNGEWVSLGNVIAWGASFANDIGYIDSDCLNTYMDFNVTGSFIKTEDFISIGGLKPSLKIAAWYEFLLRACHNGLKVFVVPKIGYAHTIHRKGSYMEEASHSISPEEGKWLIATAKEEYFFKEDRKKEYGK